MPKEKVIKRFSSSLDDSVTLVEVFSLHDDFVVRVMGEPDTAFNNEQEALKYAEQKSVEF